MKNGKSSPKEPLLDIIVPHYKEPWTTVEKFFSILDMQRGIDFSQFQVIFVNDGEENAFPAKNFSSRPYKVTQISIPHAGVSAARNAGLKKAEAEWVMFCDCDDMFFHPYAMMDILNVLPAKEADLLWSDIFIEDTRHFVATVIQKKGMNTVFIHGKLYRRQFLIDNEIWFDETVPYCEDSLFNSFAYTIADERRIGRIATQVPTYVWCDVDGSVTNTSDTKTHAHEYIYYRNRKICDLYKQKRPYDEYCCMIARTIIDCYYSLNVPQLSENAKEMKKHFRGWYLERKKEWEKVPYETLKIIKEKSRNSLHPLPPDLIESISVTQWLKNLENEAETESVKEEI